MEGPLPPAPGLSPGAAWVPEGVRRRLPLAAERVDLTLSCAEGGRRRCSFDFPLLSICSVSVRVCEQEIASERGGQVEAAAFFFSQDVEHLCWSRSGDV